MAATGPIDEELVKRHREFAERSETLTSGVAAGGHDLDVEKIPMHCGGGSAAQSARAIIESNRY